MTEAGESREHVASILIEAPIQSVWDEITKTGSIQRALYNTVLESTLQPGARLRYYSPDRKRVFVVGEVVEVEPPTRFVHTYVFTMKPGAPTLVTWDLDETPDGCRVTITHSGWTEAHEDVDKQIAGWREILRLLKAEVETGSIPLKTRVQYAMMGMMSFMLPKTTRVDYADEQGW